MYVGHSMSIRPGHYTTLLTIGSPLDHKRKGISYGEIKSLVPGEFGNDLLLPIKKMGLAIKARLF